MGISAPKDPGPLAAAAPSGATFRTDTPNEYGEAAEKVAPVGADRVLIEDSAAANAKKFIQVSNLPAGAPAAHAGDHVTGGGDTIRDATAAQDGLAIAAQIAKLDGIESLATTDQSDAEIETAYNNQVAVVGQAEAEAGVAVTRRGWTAQRVGQAIAALGGGGGSLTLGTPAVNTDKIFVTGDLGKWWLVSPTAPRTLTLPSPIANANTAIRLVFTGSTTFDNYVDVLPGVGEFSAMCSTFLKKMRIWKPCDAYFWSDGAGWHCYEGSVWDVVPFYFGETEGTLGWGLFEIIAPGVSQNGLLRGTPLQLSTTAGAHSNSLQKITTSEVLDGADKFYFGVGFNAADANTVLTHHEGTPLILTGTAKQFVVLVGDSNTWTGDAESTRIYGAIGHNAIGTLVFANATNKLQPWINDGDPAVHSYDQTAVLADDELFSVIAGWDEADNGFYNHNGSAIAAMTLGGLVAEVNPASVAPFMIGGAAGSGASISKVKVVAGFHYHGRSRWTDDEAADHWAVRALSKGRVLTMLRHRLHA